MQCRKCGAKDITRRKAGVFFCQHCGMQPGTSAMDRNGFATRVALPPIELAADDYVFATRQPRLIAGAQKG